MKKEPWKMKIIWTLIFLFIFLAAFFLSNWYTFETNLLESLENMAENTFLLEKLSKYLSIHNSGTPEQASPWSIFRIQKVGDTYLVTILKDLLLTIGLAWRKSVLASLHISKNIDTFKQKSKYFFLLCM